MTATMGVERFERLYQESPDPWGYRRSAYEREKYAASLAALGRPSYGLCLELGCSIGVFTGDQVHDRLALELAEWHVLDARQDGNRIDRFDGR